MTLGFFAILTAGAGVVFSDVRELLFALSATGLFGIVLIVTLRAERQVPRSVAEAVYATTAANEAAIARKIAGSQVRLYVPDTERSQVFLYVPPTRDYDIPPEPTIPWSIDDEDTGLILEPTGASLYQQFQTQLTGDLGDGVTKLALALTDGLVKEFELARSANVDVWPEEGRATIAVQNGSFGDVDQFDHPIGSFLAVGFAAGLDRPVELNVKPDGGRADWSITCSWDPDTT
ncbi:hypothetical protein OB955_21870 [Halobacteria archaeon AArc-m2/3/4]|uniref:DUF7982 domain-containing protein n=1 Tax=Natronoglomus mannanivorans TaxID=2979990 RepID=A0ABT2QK87_9EURY|nr:hypothetical protein [Halobacteria archaeon AArc-m2/3/4]